MKKIPWKPKYYLGLALFLIIAIYTLYQTRDLIVGPELIVRSPGQNSKTESPLVTVSGQAKRISKIYLNNSPIFTDEQGNFREKLLLSPGYNILKLTIQDRFGRSVERRLGVVY